MVALWDLKLLPAWPMASITSVPWASGASARHKDGVGRSEWERLLPKGSAQLMTGWEKGFFPLLPPVPIPP